jgi:D-alanyl-D-alanine carboxypeptidase/D-alanyl-D-alanine-endopeptidase (penicillin-binding protein 4)
MLLNGRRLRQTPRSGALLCAALLTLATAADAADFDNLTRLAAQGARVSAAVWDLDSDKPLMQLQASQRLTPASLSKIVIAAAALDTWPPDKTFPTELRATTALQNGVLQGNLILRGSGDATLDETTLWALAAQLRSAGLKRVTGNLLVERAPFGELGCDTVDRCASVRRSSRAYNAAPSAIGVNYGSWCIAIRATAPNQAASVSGCATGSLPIPLAGRIMTAAAGGSVRVDRSTDEHGDRISVSGGIAQGTERQLHRAMSDPVAGAGINLRSILLQTGVAVDGQVETIAQAVAGATQLLARVDGLPLQEQLGRMMRYSNNYIADVLTMGVALERNHAAPRSLADASTLLSDLVRSANPASAGATDAAVMHSGSGLTTSNSLSAFDFIGVLKREYHDTRHFPTFYGALVVPQDASFDYLQNGNADWLNRVALKTGSLTEPYSVNGMAGYLRKKTGGWMAFAIIVNGSDQLRQIPHERALAAARTDLEAVLAGF